MRLSRFGSEAWLRSSTFLQCVEQQKFLKIPIGSVALVAVLVGVLALLSSNAMAATKYSYVGNPFMWFSEENPPADSYSSNDFVEGYFLLERPLEDNLHRHSFSDDVVQFHFTDGRNLFSSSDEADSLFIASTDQSGKITEWTIYVSNIPLSEPLKGVIYGELSTRHSFDELTSDYVTTTECFSDLCTSSAWDQALNSYSPGVWKREVSVSIPFPSYTVIALAALMVISVHRFDLSRQISLGVL